MVLVKLLVRFGLIWLLFIARDGIVEPWFDWLWYAHGG